MPRQARVKSESGIYHVMLRGINQQQIFEEAEDYEKLLAIVKECKARPQGTVLCVVEGSETLPLRGITDSSTRQGSLGMTEGIKNRVILSGAAWLRSRRI